MDPLELEGEVKSAGDGDCAEEIFQQERLVGETYRIGWVNKIINLLEV